MRKTTTLALTATLTAAAAFAPLVLTRADEKDAGPERLVPVPQQGLPAGLIRLTPLTPPPVPVVPEGTKMTEEIKGTIALINNKLVDPMRSYSNKRVLMSRIRVRTEIEYHFAITDTSESLFPFDLYQLHRNGKWDKIASGVAHPGMESLKVAMPETGAMVDPIKHPLFAAALTELKRAAQNRAG